MQKNKVFFHFGPGAHSLVEQEIFTDNSFFFWNQPKYEGSGEYIPFLIEQANKVISERIIECSGKIELVAHSFGAFIAQNLDPKLKDELEKVTFIAPTFDFFESITNMMSHVLSVNENNELSEEFAKMVDMRKADSFWSFFGNFINKYPDYFKYYFGEYNKFEKYVEVSSKYSAVEERTLLKGITELIENYKQQRMTKKFKNIEVIIGQKDPLISKNQVDEILNTFGTTNVKILDCGHFPHFETKIF